SSRRRHTISKRDWSSDVCSSDLMNGVNYMLPFVIAGGIIIALSFAFGITAADPASEDYNVIAGALSRIGGDTAFAMMVPALAGEIGRASCREGVWREER